jgi:hypothetical protein
MKMIRLNDVNIHSKCSYVLHNICTEVYVRSTLYYCTRSPLNLCTVCHMKNEQSSTNFFPSKISLLDVEKALLRGFNTEIMS